MLVERIGEPCKVLETHGVGAREAADEVAARVAREFKPRVMRVVRQRLVYRRPEGGYLVRVEGMTGEDYFRVSVVELVARLDGKGNAVTSA